MWATAANALACAVPALITLCRLMDAIRPTAQVRSLGRTSPRVNVDQWITGQQFDLFQGSHDGYSRLPSPVIHRRWVFHRKGKFWMVRDLAEGRGLHQLDIAWHMGPTIPLASSKEYLFSGEAGSLALLTAEGHGWSQSVSRDYWSPVYGHAERASVLTFGAKVELPADFATLLIAGENLPGRSRTSGQNQWVDLRNGLRLPIFESTARGRLFLCR